MDLTGITGLINKMQMDLEHEFPSFETGFMVNPFDQSSSYSIINSIDKIEFDINVYDHYSAQEEAKKRDTVDVEAE